MIRSFVAVAALLGATVAAQADTQPGAPFVVFGVGNRACQTWLAAGVADIEARSWIVGYWSGLNASQLSDAGRTAGADAVVAEVRHTCESEPSMPLLEAVERAHARLAEAHR